MLRRYRSHPISGYSGRTRRRGSTHHAPAGTAEGAPVQVLKSSDVLSLAAKRPRRLRLRPQFGKCQTLQLLTRSCTRLARPLAADTGAGRPSSAEVGGSTSPATMDVGSVTPGPPGARDPSRCDPKLPSPIPTTAMSGSCCRPLWGTAPYAPRGFMQGFLVQRALAQRNYLMPARSDSAEQRIGSGICTSQY